MNKKELYKQQNDQFLESLSQDKEVYKLVGGIYYKVIESGSGKETPRLNSIVSVHYKGTLINGREFDNSWKRNYPEAFRLHEVIEGWQIALQQMHVCDKCIISIHYTLG